MKKLFTIPSGGLFSLLLCLVMAMAIASCDSPLDTGTPAQDTTAPAARAVPRTMAFNVVEIEDGYITLENSAPVSQARALSLPLAKAATDYYEVIFVDDASETSRRTFKEGQVIRMKVKTGIKYNNTEGFAYMAAGIKSNMTLLGVGKISKIEYDSATVNAVDEGGSVSGTNASNYTAGDFLIDDHTYKVWFELEALTTDVKDHNLSTFYTWDPASTAPTAGSFDNNPAESVLTINVGNSAVPVFVVSKSTLTTATITIKTSFEDVVMLQTLPSTPTSAEIFNNKGFFEAGTDVPLVEATIAATDAGIIDTSTAGVIKIPISITPPGVEKVGFTLFTYRVPVYMLNNANGLNTNNPNGDDSAATWYLQGGVTNPLYDLGPAVDSQGGTIVLGVGTAAELGEILDDVNGTSSEDGFIVTPNGP